LAARFRPDHKSMVRAPTVTGQIPAPVRGHYLQPWMPVQHAAEDEMGQRNGRLQRLSDDVAEIVGTQALAQRRPKGVNENDRTEFFSRRPERGELAGVQLHLVHRGRDLNALESEALHRVAQLLRSQLRMLKRERSETDQAVGMPRTQLRNVFVLQ